MSEETIQIRRYPNRRFYDRQSRQYINLSDIEALVKAGKTVEVRDSKTGEDLTRSILTQIILERHPERMSLFPVALLHHLLRANDAVTEFFRDSMRQSMEVFERLKGPLGPLGPMGPIMPPPASPLSAFRPPLDWMEALFKGYLDRAMARTPAPAGGAAGDQPDPPPDPDPADAPPEDPSSMPSPDPVADRIAHLEARLGQLEADAAQRARADDQKARAADAALIERLERRIKELEGGRER